MFNNQSPIAIFIQKSFCFPRLKQKYMSNKIIIAVVVAFIGVIVLAIAIVFLGFFGAGFYYFQGRNAPQQQPQQIETSSLKLVDMAGKEKDTQKFLSEIYNKQGLEGVKAWIDSNVQLPCNIRISFSNDLGDYKGVTYIGLNNEKSADKHFAEWGTLKGRGKIQSLGIFPKGYGDNQHNFVFVIQYQEKTDVK